MPASVVLYDAASLQSDDDDDLRSFRMASGQQQHASQRQQTDHSHDQQPQARRHVRLSDRRLADLAEQTTRSINWDVLRSSAALWDKKRVRHTTSLSLSMGSGNAASARADDFSLYTRKNREMRFFMATGSVSCSLVEMRNILRATSDEKYAATMSELYGANFIYGAVVHRTSSHATAAAAARARARSAAAKAGGNSSTSRSSSHHQSTRSGGASVVSSLSPSASSDHTSAALSPGGLLSPDSYDLLVKTATFVRPHMFARNEQWCYLDYFQPQKDHSGFVLAMSSLDPDDVFVGKTKANVSQLQGLTAAYSVALDPARRGVLRVVFYAQIVANGYLITGISRSSTNSSIRSQVKRAASTRTLSSRLLEMAEATSRLPTIVRRRRLGAQVFADCKALAPSNTRCICCTKALHLLKKKKKCHLCAYFVCEKCSVKQHMQRSRLKLYVVRICEHCIERVDEANYDNLPPEGMSPPAIRPNAPDAPPAGKKMTDMLRESLERATSPPKKKAVMQVIKYLVDADDKATTPVEAKKPGIRLTEETSEAEYVRALETRLHLKETPADRIELFNSKSRKYPIAQYKDTVDNAAVPAPKYPLPANEQHRLNLIKQRRLTEMKGIAELEIICSIASKELNCSVSLVTVVAQDDVHVLAATAGFDHASLPRKDVFCAHAIMSGNPIYVPHPEADINFNKLQVVSEGGVRFYFGFPLKAEDDTVLGTVCCFGEEPREVSQAQFAAIEKLAEAASRILQFRVNEKTPSEPRAAAIVAAPAISA
ncbi:Fyve finger-containing protein [Globisporangium polare]